MCICLQKHTLLTVGVAKGSGVLGMVFAVFSRTTDKTTTQHNNNNNKHL